MELRRVLTILQRRWWLVLGLPLVVLVGSLVRQGDRPYVAQFRATVLLPGDNEDTGNSERPELMIMDDVPTIVQSRGFAARVVARLPQSRRGLPDGPPPMDAGEVRDSIEATRYSRVLTVRVTRADGDQARMIAEAASDVLDAAINDYAVAAGAQPATVQIFDPVEVSRDSSSRVILAVQTLVALAVGGGLAGLASGLDRRLYEDEDIVATLGLPILADVRDPRRPRSGLGWGRSRLGRA